MPNIDCAFLWHDRVTLLWLVSGIIRGLIHLSLAIHSRGYQFRRDLDVSVCLLCLPCVHAWFDTSGLEGAG